MSRFEGDGQVLRESNSERQKHRYTCDAMNSFSQSTWPRRMRAALCLASLSALCAACGSPEPKSAGPTSDELGPPPAVSSDSPRLRRLTQVQYKNAVVDLFGDDLVLPVSLEPDIREEGLKSVGASSTSISPRGVEQYEDAAYDLAEQVVAWPDRVATWMDCDLDEEVTQACAEDLARSLGRRAWRRALDDEEVTAIATVITTIGAEADDPSIGTAYGISAILQDPRFVYRVELGADDGSGGRVLTDLELASRLSFLLWNSIPDEALLSAAEAGELSQGTSLHDQAVRLMADDRAREGLRNFFTELYQLDLLDSITKDPLVIPQASPEVGLAARAETLAVLEAIVFDEDADFRTVITTRRTFIDRRLAAIYGVQAPDVEQAAWTELPEDGGRRGILGHVSFLMLNAHNSTTSATLRGKFVRERMLCQVMPAPPADVDTSIPEADETSPTLRDRVAVHLEDPSCAGCHTLMDPIGLGFENFDAIGRWRSLEKGAQIDPSGNLDGTDFADAWEMASVLSRHDQFSPCLAQNLYQYTTGLVLDEGEEELVAWLAEGFAADGHSVQAMVLRMIDSPGFRQVGEIQ